MAKIYDPLGLASPIMLDGKHPIRIICEKHLPWDDFSKKYKKSSTSIYYQKRTLGAG